MCASSLGQGPVLQIAQTTSMRCVSGCSVKEVFLRGGRGWVSGEGVASFEGDDDPDRRDDAAEADCRGGGKPTTPLPDPNAFVVLKRCAASWRPSEKKSAPIDQEDRTASAARRNGRRTMVIRASRRGDALVTVDQVPGQRTPDVADADDWGDRFGSSPSWGMAGIVAPDTGPSNPGNPSSVTPVACSRCGHQGGAAARPATRT